MVLEELHRRAEHVRVVSGQLVFGRLALADVGAVDGHASTRRSTMNVAINVAVRVAQANVLVRCAAAEPAIEGVAAHRAVAAGLGKPFGSCGHFTGRDELACHVSSNTT